MRCRCGSRAPCPRCANVLRTRGGPVSDDKRDDTAWLLARERGQRGAAIPEASAARYRRLEALVAELPATPIAPPPGWQQRMLAALDAMSDDPVGGAVTTPLPERRTGRRRWVVPVVV